MDRLVPKGKLMFTTGPAFFSAAPGATCPDYSTVTLRVESDTYTPPTGDAVLTVLNCPYTPPTVV